jgi:hypothetical protein
MMMDGYEYERKVLHPKWEKEKERFESEKTSESENSRRMFSNPSNFYPELSPDYELFKSTKRSKWV